MYRLHVQFPTDLIGVHRSESIEPVEIEGGVNEPFGAPAQQQQDEACDEQESLENMNRLLEAFVESIDELESRRSQSLSELQQAAVEIAVIVANNIVRRAISADDYGVVDLVNEVISRLGAEKTVTVYLHPNDHRLFEEQLKKSEKTLHAVAARVQVKTDPKLQPGDCYADAGDFGLLSTIEQQLTDLRQMLLEGLDDAEVGRRKARSASEIIRRFPDRRETA